MDNFQNRSLNGHGAPRSVLERARAEAGCSLNELTALSDRDHRGPATLHRISWSDEAPSDGAPSDALNLNTGASQ